MDRRQRGGLLAKVQQRLAREGFAGLLRHARQRLTERGVALKRRLLQHRSHVFVWEPDGGSLRNGSLVVTRVGAEAEMPAGLRAALRAAYGEDIFESDRFEFDHGAVLWVATEGEVVVGSALSRRGAHFSRWFVALGADDVVIFRNQILPQFRGRGFCPDIMRSIVARELAGDAKAFVDCKVHNHASIRSIEKAGFRRIATLKPIPLRDLFR